LEEGKEVSTDVVKKNTAIKPIEEVRNALTANKEQIQMALPKHIPADRFIRFAITAIQNNPNLLSCERQSLYNACMRSAQDGLLPDGRQGAIVSYGGKAQWLPMVGGLIQRAYETGIIKTMDAQVVYENDTYESWSDEKGAHFKYVRARKDRGEPILTFAHATTKEGGFFFEEVDEEQMEKIENSSKAKNGPWKGDFKDEMRRKSALKRLIKRLPSSPELQDIVQRDNEDFGSELLVEESGNQPKQKLSRLSKIVEQKKKEKDLDLSPPQEEEIEEGQDAEV
jgi:recombination protein RecT